MEISFAFMCASFGFCFGVLVCRLFDLWLAIKAGREITREKEHYVTLSEVIALLDLVKK